MKHLTAVLISALLLLGAQAFANDQNGTRQASILVSQDFTEVLAKALTADSSIEVIRAIPADFSPDVHTYYLKKYFERFSRLAQRAYGVITVASSWPDDPLYPWARRANIRIVNIDAITPLDKSRAGVPLLDFSAQPGKSPVVWNSPGNTARIADIVGTDLQMLFPSEREQIQANLNSLKKALFKLRSRFETAIGMADYFEVIAFSFNHAYLTEEFGIALVDSLVKPGAKVTPQEVMEVATRARAKEVQVVLCGRSPSTEINDLLVSQGLKVVVLRDFSYNAAQPAQQQLLAFHEHNLEVLVQGLTATQ